MAKLIDILSYGGSTPDIVINYVVCSVVLFAAGRAQLRDVEASRASLCWASSALAFVIAFQLGLCTVIGCTGISIIWNAAAGYAVIFELRAGPLRVWGEEVGIPTRHRAHGRPPARPAPTLVAALVLCAAADVFYAAVAPPLTTAAHGCALVLGAVLAAAHGCVRRLAACCTATSTVLPPDAQPLARSDTLAPT